MNMKVIFSAFVAVAFVASGTAAYLQFGVGSHNSANHTISDSTHVGAISNLTRGSHIMINKNDKQMLRRVDSNSPYDNGYFAVEFPLKLNNDSILTGSWDSSGKSLVWLYVDRSPYMNVPFPDSMNGTLNQTLGEGQYTLIVGGQPGDVITITATIAVSAYTPHQISNFSIQAGTNIKSGARYSFHLDKPGELVGSITTREVPCSISLHNSTAQVFSWTSYNSSAQLSSITFKFSVNSTVFAPGYYTLTFNGVFNVSKTLNFIAYYNNSTL